MPNSKRSINGIPLGMWARKQIGKASIFRVRHGNGFYGAILGHKYQDKYIYVVPGNVNNIEGQPARDALTQAVYNWKNTLTPQEKAEYNSRAAKGLHMSGYNLYIREYMLANL